MCKNSYTIPLIQTTGASNTFVIFLAILTIILRAGASSSIFASFHSAVNNKIQKKRSNPNEIKCWLLRAMFSFRWKEKYVKCQIYQLSRSDWLLKSFNIFPLLVNVALYSINQEMVFQLNNPFRRVVNVSLSIRKLNKRK